jgi:hypothetical protein
MKLFTNQPAHAGINIVAGVTVANLSWWVYFYSVIVERREEWLPVLTVVIVNGSGDNMVYCEAKRNPLT